MKKIMTLSLGSLLLAALITISSCSKEPLIVPYSLADKNVCFDANPNTHTQVDSVTIHHADLIAALTAAGITDVTRATSAKIKDGITITGTTFDHMAGFQVYLKVAGTSGDGDQIAYSDAIATGVTFLTLKINGAELKQALSNDMTLLIKTTNNAAVGTQQCYILTKGVIDISVRK